MKPTSASLTSLRNRQREISNLTVNSPSDYIKKKALQRSLNASWDSYKERNRK